MRTKQVTIQSVQRELSRVQKQPCLLFTVFDEDGKVYFNREYFSAKIVETGPNIGKSMVDVQTERMAKFLDRDNFLASNEELDMFKGEMISITLDDETYIDETSQEEVTVEAVKSMILAGGHGIEVADWAIPATSA